MPINISKTINKINTKTQVEVNKNNSIDYYIKEFEGPFFVVGRTYNGGRFYSETISNYDDTIKMFYDYCDMVKYFNGGFVEIYHITAVDNECNIIYHQVI